ncbi:hypothetical protein HMPREF0541_00996 [Lacticaseibacillus rhamnosus ATCC 21052]|nr:hypothetical protein HMPREF0541_00996 [Lacticaseibacillus rhamnosus ATCC 21052]
MTPLHSNNELKNVFNFLLGTGVGVESGLLGIGLSRWFFGTLSHCSR